MTEKLQNRYYAIFGLLLAPQHVQYAVCKLVKLHLSVLLGGLLIIPFGNVLIPYIYWVLNRKKNGSNFTNHARNILDFQILISILLTIYITVFWYIQIVNMSQNAIINFSFLRYYAIVAIIVVVIYPLIASFLLMKKKNGKVLFYPKTIHFFSKSK